MLCSALQALARLSLCGEAGVQAVLELGCTARMADLLGHASVSVSKLALVGLRELVHAGQLQRQAALNAGALQHLAVRLGPGYSDDFSLMASGVAMDVCSGTQGNIQALLRAQCGPVLIHRAAHSEPELAENYLLALTSVCCRGSASQVSQLMGMGLLATLGSCLQPARGTVPLQMSALCALRCILDCTEPAGLHCRAVVGAGLHRALQRLAGSEGGAQEMARLTLEELGGYCAGEAHV